jgi:hypothetical protein
MEVNLIKTYDVAMLQTYTISITEEEYDKFILDNPTDNGIDYEDMYDYFEANGYNVEMLDEATDYQNNGVEVEFIA